MPCRVAKKKKKKEKWRFNSWSQIRGGILLKGRQGRGGGRALVGSVFSLCPGGGDWEKHNLSL